jgi:hypothetical protein
LLAGPGLICTGGLEIPNIQSTTGILYPPAASTLTGPGLDQPGIKNKLYTLDPSVMSRPTGIFYDLNKYRLCRCSRA